MNHCRSKLKIYKASLISPRTPEELEVRENVFLIVRDGIIEEICKELPERYKGLACGRVSLQRKGASVSRLTTLDEGASCGELPAQSKKASNGEIPEQDADISYEELRDGFLIPAFSDLHIHAPQFTQRGIGMDCLLFDWLNRYTFPEEARFADVSYARTIYTQLIRELLRHGTLHANFFTTIHYEACDLFFRMLEESGMYAFAGKINMDRNAPAYYIEETRASLEETERFLAEHRPGKIGRVRPMIIPRFAPTCSEELLKGLGDLSQKYQVGVHTHLVESREEAAWAKELFPQCASDGEIYERCGLLGNGPSVFAHVIFPTAVEERILKQYGAVSVHCPDATTNITAGIMPAKRMQENAFALALGSDIGGGHFPGVYRQVARAVQLSKLKEFYEPKDGSASAAARSTGAETQSVQIAQNERESAQEQPGNENGTLCSPGQKCLTFANAFYMATAGGGEVFSTEEAKIGKLAPGHRFNALLLGGLTDEGRKLTLPEQLERFCYIGDDRNIRARFLDGELVDPDAVYARIAQG